jgi:NADH-quinone oxidoreductase subunit L
MFVGVGIGAYSSGLFHLMTHAFFKALLFLAAGVIIHALGGEQDMRRMGGMRRYLPKTYICFLAGALALVGIPPFSGFFSKDLILAGTLATGGWWGYTLFVAGIVGAFFTGLYTFRLIFLVFTGEPSAYAREHIHTDHGEGPFSMMSVVAVLAVGATVAGWLQISGLWSLVTDFLNPAATPLVDATSTQEWITSAFAVAVGVLGIVLAWLVYGARKVPVPSWTWIRHALEHKLYFDEAYDYAFFKPAALLAVALRHFVEIPLIAGSLRTLGLVTREAGAGVGDTETGLVRTYVFALASGVAILLLVFVAVR